MATDMGDATQTPIGEGLSKDEKMWGMLCHLSSLLGYTVIPFGNVVGPLIVWLVKKDEYPFVDDQGKESLNFQITLLIAAVVAFLCVFVLIGFILLPLVWLVGLIFSIIGAVSANNGTFYRYPFAIRIIK